MCLIKKYDVVQNATSRDNLYDAVCTSRHPNCTMSKTDFQWRSIEPPDHKDKVRITNIIKKYKEMRAWKQDIIVQIGIYLLDTKWAFNMINRKTDRQKDMWGIVVKSHRKLWKSWIFSNRRLFFLKGGTAVFPVRWKLQLILKANPPRDFKAGNTDAPKNHF